MLAQLRVSVGRRLIAYSTANNSPNKTGRVIIYFSLCFLAFCILSGLLLQQADCSVLIVTGVFTYSGWNAGEYPSWNDNSEDVRGLQYLQKWGASALRLINVWVDSSTCRRFELYRPGHCHHLRFAETHLAGGSVSIFVLSLASIASIIVGSRWRYVCMYFYKSWKPADELLVYDCIH